MLFRILGKMNLNTSLIIALYSLLTSCSHGYHVMFIHEMGTKSHLLQLFPMVETLLARGHEVSGVFYSPSKINHENYTEILLPNVMDEFKEEIRYSFIFILFTLHFTKSNYSKIYMEKGGQSIWNWKLWSFAFEIWDDIIDQYSVMTFNKEVD